MENVKIKKVTYYFIVTLLYNLVTLVSYKLFFNKMYWIVNNSDVLFILYTPVISSLSWIGLSIILAFLLSFYIFQVLEVYLKKYKIPQYVFYILFPFFHSVLTFLIQILLVSLGIFGAPGFL